MKTRATIIFDSSDMGAFVRLQEEGIIKKMTTEMLPEDEAKPPRERAKEFAETIRSNEDHHERRPRDGLRGLEIVLAIMQSIDKDRWTLDEIERAFHIDYGKNGHSASPLLSKLVQHDYVERLDLGVYCLTELGKNHPQKERLPF